MLIRSLQISLTTRIVALQRLQFSLQFTCFRMLNTINFSNLTDLGINGMKYLWFNTTKFVYEGLGSVIVTFSPCCLYTREHVRVCYCVFVSRSGITTESYYLCAARRSRKAIFNRFSVDIGAHSVEPRIYSVVRISVIFDSTVVSIHWVLPALIFHFPYNRSIKRIYLTRSWKTVNEDADDPFENNFKIFYTILDVYAARMYNLALRNRHIGKSNVSRQTQARCEICLPSENRFSVSRSIVVKGCKAQSFYDINIIFKS